MNYYFKIKYGYPREQIYLVDDRGMKLIYQDEVTQFERHITWKALILFMKTHGGKLWHNNKKVEIKSIDMMLEGDVMLEML